MNLLDETGYYTGQRMISHDNGESWHGADQVCPVCRDEMNSAGQIAVVTAVDKQHGTITVGHEPARR